METSKQPLYKVLNEDRTQGKWQVSKYPAIGYPNVIKSEFTSSHIALMGLPTEGDDNTVEAQANAQYIALAVNNLHHLAEALEDLRTACMMDSDIPTAWWKKHKQTVAKAKEALNRIS